MAAYYRGQREVTGSIPKKVSEENWMFFYNEATNIGAHWIPNKGSNTQMHSKI